MLEQKRQKAELIEKLVYRRKFFKVLGWVGGLSPHVAPHYLFVSFDRMICNKLNPTIPVRLVSTDHFLYSSQSKEVFCCALSFRRLLGFLSLFMKHGQGKTADSGVENFLESLESFEITWSQRNFEIIDSGGSTSRRFGDRHPLSNLIFSFFLHKNEQIRVILPQKGFENRVFSMIAHPYC